MSYIKQELNMINFIKDKAFGKQHSVRISLNIKESFSNFNLVKLLLLESHPTTFGYK